MIFTITEKHSDRRLTGLGQQTKVKPCGGEKVCYDALISELIFRTSDSGKTLGGSSSINGGHWTRGLAAQYDAWSDLLEASEASVGWNWQNISSYMKKVILFPSFIYTTSSK